MACQYALHPTALRPTQASPRTRWEENGKSLPLCYGVRCVVYLSASHHTNVLFLSPDRTPETHEEWVEKYGKTFRFHGFGSVRTSPLNGLHGGELTANDSDFFNISQYDYRLMSLDLRAVSHVLNSPVYEKPWQTRKLLSRLLGRGALFCHLFIALIVQMVTHVPTRPFRCICDGGRGTPHPGPCAPRRFSLEMHRSLILFRSLAQDNRSRIHITGYQGDVPYHVAEGQWIVALVEL